MKMIIFYVSLKIMFVIISHNLKAIEAEVFVETDSNNYCILNKELLFFFFLLSCFIHFIHPFSKSLLSKKDYFSLLKPQLWLLFDRNHRNIL